MSVAVVVVVVASAALNFAVSAVPHAQITQKHGLTQKKRGQCEIGCRSRTCACISQLLRRC